MQAASITQYGDADGLSIQRRPVPTPRAKEVLIRVHAAGINRPDIFQRKGNYPAPPGVVADIPGLEVAGVVEACGAEVKRWVPGDRVCALLGGGGYAEFAAADEAHCLPIPANLDFVEAACLPETVFTVWHNVFQRGKLQCGETLLVHGGSGGIGTTAIQLGTAFGARVYATAGTREKCDFCEQLGAVAGINYHERDFAEELAGERIDVILDSIGAPYFEKHLSLLADEGRLVFINAVAGKHVQMNIIALMQRRLTFTGSTLRSRDNAFKATLREAVENHVWPLVEKGAFKPIIHQVFPLAAASDAHRLMESGNFIGKLALEVF
ncbi:putative NAD(P)H quinone oxidoreductase, PIG3 family [Parapedobacter koreensis]|uniref:Putative NAD(P)H quinone oxidoreductase, PIG3 family n=2 Tax=Parapedobacter koreensis TaxID=332977 RepID=A0A1H7IPR6_9SPHI|nr:putative NAD(P)H quinone oxidoreductase, PIG3 family [Parapedobacter koreensis]